MTLSLFGPIEAVGAYPLVQTLQSIEFISAQAAEGYVAARECRYGDPGTWSRVVDAVDRRYDRCIPTELRGTPASGFTTNPGRIAFEQWLPRKAQAFESVGVAIACKSLLLRALLVPGSVPREELDVEYSRVDARVKYDHEMINAIRALGEDQEWVSKPCDSFWPSEQDPTK